MARRLKTLKDKGRDWVNLRKDNLSYWQKDGNSLRKPIRAHSGFRKLIR